MARVFPPDMFNFLMFAFLDQLLGFPDCWISLNRSLIFRLRSASSVSTFRICVVSCPLKGYSSQLC